MQIINAVYRIGLKNIFCFPGIILLIFLSVLKADAGQSLSTYTADMVIDGKHGQSVNKQEPFIGDFIYPDDYYRAYAYNRLTSHPMPGRSSYEVVIGGDGWFFIGNDLDRTYRKELMNDKELQQTLSFFIEIKAKCDEIGAKLIYFLAPVTSTIYSEYLPKTVKKKGKLIADQVISSVKEKTQIDIIYPKDVLLKEKKYHQVYTKTDAHWNEIGALIGARELFKAASAWFPDLEIHSLDDYTMTKKRVFGRVGPQQLNLEHMAADEVVTLEPNFVPLEKHKLPKAVVFHDSYYEAMQKFILENFNVVFKMPTTGGLAEIKNRRETVLKHIESTKPEIVIFVFCERTRIAYGF